MSLFAMIEDISCLKIEEVYSKKGFLLNLDSSDLFVNCIAAVIDPKYAAFLLDRLSEEDALPLARYHLGHLKRIRRISITETVPETVSETAATSSSKSSSSKLVQIILVPQSHSDDIQRTFTSLADLSMDMIKTTITVSVSKYMPNFREEFDAWVKYWPMNFRPSDADREREKGLHSTEVKTTNKYLSVLQGEDRAMADIVGRINCGAIIVNPVNDEIVTTTCKSIAYIESTKSTLVRNHPIYTPAMIVIEGVASLVREEVECSLDLLPLDAYLCTGLDIYLTLEPDLMSSMALVHSRIRRVIYVHSSPDDGALGSKTHLHQLRSLNHKFRVFRVKKS